MTREEAIKHSEAVMDCTADVEDVEAPQGISKICPQ